MFKHLSTKHPLLLGITLGFVLAVLISAPFVADAILVTSPPRIISIGDVTTNEILDGTIADVDISATAAIDLLKLLWGNADGSIPFAGSGGNATTSDLAFATSTRALTVGDLIVSQGTTTIRGVAYIWPSADGSNNASLRTDGAGTLAWEATGSTLVGATTTNTVVTNTTTETTYDSTGTITLTANTLGTTGILRVTLIITELDWADPATANSATLIRFKLGGATICTLEKDDAFTGDPASNLRGKIELLLINNNSTSSQIIQCSMFVGTRGTTNSSLDSTFFGGDGTASIDTTVNQDLTLTWQWTTAANTANRVTISSLIAIAN